jgi:hypothetical protein
VGTLPKNAYERAEYVSANLIWLPVDRKGVGMEYLYGFRKNKDGRKGGATRIQMAFQYKFRRRRGSGGQRSGVCCASRSRVAVWCGG